MTGIFEQEIIKLITHANQQGVNVLYKSNELTIRFLKGRSVDDVLLEQLRKKKEEIIAYFELLEKHKLEDSKLDIDELPSVRFDNDDYYFVTRIQDYWLSDDDAEFKSNTVHGTITLSYQIWGDLDPDVVKKAVFHLIVRHEALRARFKKIGNEFMMCIKPCSESAVFENLDISKQQFSFDEVEKILKFGNHKFSADGPLFICRLVKIENNRYYISFKLHHVICDTWSLKILIKELLATYKSIKHNAVNPLQAQKYHYKEFLYLIKRNVTLNEKKQQEYWARLHPEVPDKLNIPFSKQTKTDISKKILRSETFIFPAGTLDKIFILAKEFGVSLFVIFQATFNCFLYQQTGQNDLVIGTDVLGRDFPNMQNQIGCYAKTVIIRTVINADDSFREVLIKVKKANQDMTNYVAHPLLDHIGSRLPKSMNFRDFWKINLYYNEIESDDFYDHKKLNTELGFHSAPLSHKKNNLIQIDLQLRFTKTNNQIILKVEYDSSLYERRVIGNVFNEYLNYCNICVS